MLEKDSLFKQYRHKMVREGVLSAISFGLMIGSGAVFASALVCWLLNFTRMVKNGPLKHLRTAGT